MGVKVGSYLLKPCEIFQHIERLGGANTVYFSLSALSFAEAKRGTDCIIHDCSAKVIHCSLSILLFIKVHLTLKCCLVALMDGNINSSPALL